MCIELPQTGTVSIEDEQIFNTNKNQIERKIEFRSKQWVVVLTYKKEIKDVLKAIIKMLAQVLQLLCKQNHPKG